MRAHDAPAQADGTAHALRDVMLALAGLVVGAIVGLVIAGYAGWIPPLNLC